MTSDQTFSNTTLLCHHKSYRKMSQYNIRVKGSAGYGLVAGWNPTVYTVGLGTQQCHEP